MARFGKIVNNEIEYAPSTLTDKQQLYREGYQPVDETAVPVDFDKYEYTYEWQDLKKRFVKVWIRGQERPDTRPASEKRQEAYETLKEFTYGNSDEKFTVDELNTLYYRYFVELEKDVICSNIKQAINDAKAYIRELYPDPEVNEE